MSETLTIVAIETTTVPDAHRLIEGKDELGRKASWDVPAATFQRLVQAGGQVGSVVTVYDDGGFLILSNPPTVDTKAPTSPQAQVTQGQEEVAAREAPAPHTPAPRAATKPKTTTTSKAKSPAKKKPGPKPKAKAPKNVPDQQPH